MLVTEFIQQAYQVAMGESTAPTSGDENYTLLFNAGNLFIEAWQNEPDTDWNSLWGRATLESTISTTDTYTLPTSVRKVSREEDGVKLTSTTGQVQYFTCVKPTELYKGGNRVAQIKDKLVFAEPFTSGDPFIGATITVPFFGYATKLTGPTSVIPVDQPLWLVYMAGAELARHDYTKQYQAPALIDQATDFMKSMKSNNEEEQDGTVDHGTYRPLGATT